MKRECDIYTHINCLYLLRNISSCVLDMTSHEETRTRSPLLGNFPGCKISCAKNAKSAKNW